MTKRRWLKTAIEQSKKPQVALPWARDTARLAPGIVAAMKVGSGTATANA